MLDSLGFSSLAIIHASELRAADGLDVANVIGGTDKRDGDGVDVFSDGEDKVLLVLLSERGNFDGMPGRLMPLFSRACLR